MAVRKFEDALARLEIIVAELEHGELPMDDSLRIFEEGVRLSKQCMKMLEDAEKKAEVSHQDANGAMPLLSSFPTDTKRVVRDVGTDEIIATKRDEDL